MTAAFSSPVEREKFEPSLPFIPAWLDDYGLTPSEFRVYCHVVKTTQKNGKCWESVTKIASDCRLCRNLTLKALHTLTEVHKLLIRNKRVGETDEYELAPSSEWAPPVPSEDRLLSRSKKEFRSVDPSFQETGRNHPSLQQTGSNCLDEQQP